MKSILLIFNIMTISVMNIAAQEDSPLCVPERFGNQYIFAEEDIIVQSDIEYGLSQSFDGTWEPRLLDIYTVNPTLDTLTKRPLAIVLHGGGFKSGDKTDALVVESMLAIARSGYTAATFNYRLGYDEPAGPCSADADDIHRAAYRALQDAHAAMRFLFHHQDQYEIDTSFVFVGGLSAGATLASLMHYGTSEYFNENFNFLPLELGPINTSGNALEDEFHVDGLIMAWGSFPPNLNITASNVIPVVTYHGTSDDVVPIGNGTFASCPDYPTTVGPDVYIPQVESAGGCYDYNRSPNGEHGIEIYGEFYVKNRTMCFMKSLMCNQCESTQQVEGSPVCPELGLGIEEELGIETILSIAPNPSDGEQVCLLTSIIDYASYQIRILDLTGKTVREYTLESMLDSKICLDAQGLRKGYYFMQFKRDKRDVGTLNFVID